VGDLRSIFVSVSTVVSILIVLNLDKHRTYLFSRSILSSHKPNHMRLRHRLDSFPFTLLAIPLFVHLIDHTLINRRLMTIAMIWHIASIAEDNHVARRAHASKADFADCTFGVSAISFLLLVRRNGRWRGLRRWYEGCWLLYAAAGFGSRGCICLAV
jgi:hypothetical protein